MALFAVRVRPAFASSSSTLARAFCWAKPKVSQASSVGLRFYSRAVIPLTQTASAPHAVLRYQTVRRYASESRYSTLADTSSDSTDDAPKKTLRADGCDYEHWLIVMDFPTNPQPTQDEMIETYIKTLAKVVGSEEEAKKKIYGITFTGFQANIPEHVANRLKGLPGVQWVIADSYIDSATKDYGGQPFIDGKLVPRRDPKFIYSSGKSDRPSSRRYRDSMPIERRDTYQADRRDTYQSDRRDSYQGERRDSYQADRRDGNQWDRRDSYQGERREPGRWERRDAAQGEGDGYQGERRDPGRWERRDGVQGEGDGYRGERRDPGRWERRDGVQGEGDGYRGERRDTGRSER